MSTSIYDPDNERCMQCSGRMVDIEEEIVCSSCGSVRQKEVPAELVFDSGVPIVTKRVRAVDYTSRSLGSFLGPKGYEDRDDAPKGARSPSSSSSPSFKHLKTISDYSPVDATGVYPCARLIERICEKLALPQGVIGQSIAVARGLLVIRKERTGYTIAAISAFSIISACRICGISSVGMKEVITAHGSLGHSVKPSTLIKMGFDSPMKANAMRAEEHLGRVATRLGEILPRLGAPPGYQYKLLHLARRALSRLDSSVRGGHSPSALAATSFYAAEIVMSESESRKRLFTQKEVATCVGVAEYTIREQFCELFRPRWDDIHGDLSSTLRSQPSQRNAASAAGRPPLDDTQTTGLASR
jgi:transcription initiation factor TFIIIB Brf1 subunit/transcription initiation factor TFIIB